MFLAGAMLICSVVLLYNITLVFGEGQIMDTGITQVFSLSRKTEIPRCLLSAFFSVFLKNVLKFYLMSMRAKLLVPDSSFSLRV